MRELIRQAVPGIITIVSRMKDWSSEVISLDSFE